MTEVTLEDGSKVETTLPPDAVADIPQPEAKPQEPATEPQKAPEPTETKPAPEPKAEEPKAPDAPQAPEPPRDPEGKFKPKPKPIANLLAKNHDLETQLADARRQLAEMVQKPASTETSADLQAFAEKYGLPADQITELATAIRAGIKTELPKEVTDLITKSQQDKQMEQELAGFNADLGRLAKTFKDEASLTDPKVREKLLELAYSTEKAPDGEPYHQKPLHELYFTYVKPEIEPAKPSVDASRGGTQASGDILDFQDILDRDDPKDIDAMDEPTFAKYHTWLKSKQGLPPIKRSHQS